MQDHGRWCVGAHIQAFTFASEDHGRLSGVWCGGVVVLVRVVVLWTDTCVEMVVRVC